MQCYGLELMNARPNGASTMTTAWSTRQSDCLGPAHGHQIAKHIQRTTEDVLQVEHGSLYPALHRMERKRWVISKWEMAKERNREFKYYRLTPSGRNQLAREESKWKQLAAAVATVMWPAREDPS